MGPFLLEDSGRCGVGGIAGIDPRWVRGPGPTGSTHSSDAAARGFFAGRSLDRPVPAARPGLNPTGRPAERTGGG